MSTETIFESCITYFSGFFTLYCLSTYICYFRRHSSTKTQYTNVITPCHHSTETQGCTDTNDLNQRSQTSQPSSTEVSTMHHNGATIGIFVEHRRSPVANKFAIMMAFFIYWTQLTSRVTRCAWTIVFASNTEFALNTSWIGTGGARFQLTTAHSFATGWL